MKRISVYLTFDYELPLGGIAKSYKHSLFDPTDRLFDIARKLEVPITLFADILSYQKFKEHDIPEFYKHFERQISYALKHKHDVQLHIHPHWIDTRFVQNQFVPDPKFALGDFANKTYPNDIEGIIETSYNTLKNICAQTDKKHPIIAYRAGGYNLFPNTDAYYKPFIKTESK